MNVKKLLMAAALTGAWQLVIGTVLLLLIFLAPNGLVALLVRLDRRRVAAGPAALTANPNSTHAKG